MPLSDASAGRIQDKSVLAVLIVPAEGPPVKLYLACDGEVEPCVWFWVEDQALARVFPSHDVAQFHGRAHHYVDAKGVEHAPFAVVISPSQAKREARVRRELDRVERLEESISTVAPEETFAQLEKRRLA